MATQRETVIFEHIIFDWRDLLDIALVGVLLYQVIQLLRGTRALAVLSGLGVLTALYFMSRNMGLYTLSWLLQHIFGSLFILIVVIFQNDIRQALGEMGSRHFFRKKSVQAGLVDEVVAACVEMARLRVGALIVFERSVTLDEQMRSGTIINSDVTAELLKNIFYPKAPLHDGAVVIRDGRIAAAGCVLPLTSNTNLSPDLGTRHRAGIGMSEHSDAVIVIVSEETGGISIAVDGMLKRRLSPDTFEAILRSELVPAEEQQRRRWDIIVDFVKKLNPLRREKQHDKKDDDQQNSQQ